MPWDEDKARSACQRLDEHLNSLPDDVREELAGLWKELYLEAGHKRLGRIVMGQTVDQACRARGD